MVFYFTGTGNSLYVAKQLEGSPISIPQVMRQETWPLQQMPSVWLLLSMATKCLLW